MQTNSERADKARIAVSGYPGLDLEDIGTSVADLLCDMMHYCDDEDINFKARLSQAYRHYGEEMAGDE